MLWSISPEMGRALKVALSRVGMIMPVTNQECMDILEKTPGAFGTSTLSQIISEKRSFKILSFNGVKPSSKGAAVKSYLTTATTSFTDFTARTSFTIAL